MGVIGARGTRARLLSLCVSLGRGIGTYMYRRSARRRISGAPGFIRGERAVVGGGETRVWSIEPGVDLILGVSGSLQCCCYYMLLQGVKELWTREVH